MANLVLLLPLLSCLFPIQLLAVEQTLIIDFERPHSAVPRSGEYPPVDGFGNSLTIEKGTRRRQSRGDGLPSSIQELKELIGNMDKAFARRIEQLSKRLDRLEANQRHATLADWAAFSVDKRIRLFGQAKSTWQEAEQVCGAHAGQLLQIESEQENQRISGHSKQLSSTFAARSEFLQGTEALFWIGSQANLQFNFSSAVVGNYSNFEEEDTKTSERGGGDGASREEATMRRCAAISSRSRGRWLGQECSERHGFICQI